MSIRRSLHLIFLVAFVAICTGAAEDRVSTGEDIHVAPDEVIGDAVCFGCSIHAEGEISGDAVVFGGRLRIDGEVGADAVVMGGNAEISGLVAGELVAVMGNVNLLPGAEVGNDLIVVLGGLNRSDDARVLGEVTHVGGVDAAGFTSKIVTWLLLGLLAVLVMGLAFSVVLTLLCAAILGEKRVEVLSQTVRQRAGLSFLLGLGVAVGSFFVTVFPVFLGLWIPGFETLVSLAVFVLLAVGYSGLSFTVGRRLSEDSTLLAACALGAVIIVIVQVIPVIGFFAFLVFSMLAAGSALASGLGSSTDWLQRRTTRPAPPAAAN